MRHAGDAINEALHRYAEGEDVDASLRTALNTAVGALHRLQDFRNQEVCAVGLLLLWL